MSKQEANDVRNLIEDVLTKKLKINGHKITNDKAIPYYTGDKRPDILISNIDYKNGHNDKDFVNNLICYAEAKDRHCKANDSHWKDAYNQCLIKAPKLHMPFFVITNCSNTTRYYNLKTKKLLYLNGNLITHFVRPDIFRIIKRTLINNPNTNNIKVSSGAISSISSSKFHQKLQELQKIYRDINFGNSGITAKEINFTIGMISLEYYEEKVKLDKKYNSSKIYWSDSRHVQKDSQIVANLSTYINRLINHSKQFEQFIPLLKAVRKIISNIHPSDVSAVYKIVDSMHPLHGAGFDLFGSVYEMFANSKEKKDFGQYFTPRQYAHVFAKILLKNEITFNPKRLPTILDPFCGTGGMLTESYRTLKAHYKKSSCLNHNLAKKCFFGIDITDNNIFRTRLNMFLIGDGHTNMFADNSFDPVDPSVKKVLNRHYQYIITNPPYGNGNAVADTDVITSKREEIASLCLIIKKLNIGGHACVILPIGVFQNPTFTKLRDQLLRTCTVDAIISLPSYAFIPYTKEKTYALFLTKRYPWNSKKAFDYQKKPIWMYIIDNDGYSNSNKRFPTNLKSKDGSWLHNEIREYVDINGKQMPSLLEQRWRIFSDKSKPSTWINEKGIKQTYRKAGFIKISKIRQTDFLNLLPEFYLRPRKSKLINIKNFNVQLIKANKKFDKIPLKPLITKMANIHKRIESNTRKLKSLKITYQAKNVPISKVLTYMSGNSGLTEEFIYSNMLATGSRCKILSSSTKGETEMGSIPENIHAPHRKSKLKVFNNQDGILVARNGRAGSNRFLPSGHYTITDHAYILYLKSNNPYKINLHWLQLIYGNKAYDYTSSSNNGTWQKSAFFKNVKINIPSFSYQNKILACMENIQKCYRMMKQYNKEMIIPYANLFSRSIR